MHGTFEITKEEQRELKRKVESYRNRWCSGMSIYLLFSVFLASVTSVFILEHFHSLSLNNYFLSFLVNFLSGCAMCVYILVTFLFGKNYIADKVLKKNSYLHSELVQKHIRRELSKNMGVEMTTNIPEDAPFKIIEGAFKESEKEEGPYKDA